MSKLEISEQMVKAIVEYLIRYRIIKEKTSIIGYAKDGKEIKHTFVYMSLAHSKCYFEKCVLEAIVEFETKEEEITPEAIENLKKMRTLIMKCGKAKEGCPKCGSVEIVLKYVSETYTEIRCKNCGYRVGDDWRNKHDTN